MSVLFLADGRRAQVIGFNTLWTDPGDPAAPFRYGGAVNHAGLAPGQQAVVASYVAALVAALGLKGINGLDFVASESGCQVLEINPRPCATFELHDPDSETGLLALHVRACGGRLPPEVAPRARQLRAYRVVYAPRDLSIDPQRHWPRWCRDLPQPRRRIRAGEPVCTVHAAGTQPAAVSARAAARWNALTGALGRAHAAANRAAEAVP